MKDISNLLAGIENIATYYNVGLIIFVVFFAVIVYKTYKMPKKDAEQIKNSILD